MNWNDAAIANTAVLKLYTLKGSFSLKYDKLKDTVKVMTINPGNLCFVYVKNKPTNSSETVR